MSQTQQPTIWGLSISFSIIAIAAVALRFYARRIKGQKLGADDWTVLVALILSLGVSINLLIMTQVGGLGTHLEYNDDGSLKDVEAFDVFMKTIFAFEVLTWPTVGVTKISVVLLYQRIFTTQRFKMLCWILIMINCAWTIAFTLALTFSCIPVASSWDLTLDSTCVDLKTLFTTALATDVATDFLVLILPIYKIWQLQMSTARKIMVMFIFLLGGLVSIVGIIRIHYLTEVYDILEVDLELADTTWIYSQVYYWQIIEVNVGVLSACLPTLRPVHERLTRNLSFTQLRGSFEKLLISSRGTREVEQVRLNSMEQGVSDNFNSKSSKGSSDQMQTRRQDQRGHWPPQSTENFVDGRGPNGVNNHWRAEHV
ncbi:hypothetical protein KVR01_004319 [Diaporthe batatas]|uniref:uncharacterized protein n=1 Tax=Diaporthe batatas TaxID=748121 RepID=UPI001D04349D|nr:uncharacterized protein KVR01_004319 [Diaporthe batatas]KAG8165767.1 hypothetical protein KVR01_004319 [Diaporthe batatas]